MPEPGGALPWTWRGRLPYALALEEQRQRRADILAGRAVEEIWLLEHDPVITTGRRQVEDLPEPALLQQRGISLHQTERGGLATFHGPGQLVAYLLVDAGARGIGVRDFVSRVEDALIRTLAQLGLGAARRAGFPGVWVGSDKISAIGLHFQRGVSLHGLALNLCPDLSAYSLFSPCGIQDGGVTSVKALLGRSPSPRELAPALGGQLAEAIRGDFSGEGSGAP